MREYVDILIAYIEYEDLTITRLNLVEFHTEIFHLKYLLKVKII